MQGETGDSYTQALMPVTVLVKTKLNGSLFSYHLLHCTSLSSMTFKISCQLIMTTFDCVSLVGLSLESLQKK